MALFSGKPLVGNTFCHPERFFEGLRTFWWFQRIWALFRVPTHFTHGSVKLLEISIELAHTQANWGQSWNRALYLNQNLFPNLCFLPGKDAHCDPAQKNLVLHFFVFLLFGQLGTPQSGRNFVQSGRNFAQSGRNSKSVRALLIFASQMWGFNSLSV